jgi:hypothetical protein
MIIPISQNVLKMSTGNVDIPNISKELLIKIIQQYENETLNYFDEFYINDENEKMSISRFEKLIATLDKNSEEYYKLKTTYKFQRKSYIDKSPKNGYIYDDDIYKIYTIKDIAFNFDQLIIDNDDLFGEITYFNTIQGNEMKKSSKSLSIIPVVFYFENGTHYYNNVDSFRIRHFLIKETDN